MKTFLFIVLTLLFSVNCLADYALESEVASSNVSKVYVKKPKLPGKYVKLPKSLNLAYHVLADEYVDDLTKPKFLKGDLESCIDDADCQTKLEAKVCSDGQEAVKVLTGPKEVYCKVPNGYEQKLSGNKIVVEDAAKKAIFMTAKADEETQNQAEKTRRQQARAMIVKLKNDEDLTPTELRKVLIALLRQLRD